MERKRRRKRSTAAALALALVLTASACAPKNLPEEGTGSEAGGSGQEQPSGQTGQTGQEQPSGSLAALLADEAAWELDPAGKRIDVPWQPRIYETDAPQYDFSLAGLENKDQFTGFTKSQAALLEKNGFVVLKPSETTPLKINHVYEQAEYMDYPVFITADAVLNLYHVFYSESMKLYEIANYHPALVDLTQSMLDKALLAHEEASPAMAEEAALAAAYFGVAMALLGGEPELPEDIRAIVDEETARILAAEAYTESAVFGHEVDYTQYVVRGHYTRAEALGQYFRAMMWYGQNGFKVTRIENGEEVIDEKALATSLHITSLLMAGGSEDLERWLAIYDMTSLYSGTSDDLNILDFAETIETVFGRGAAPDAFKDPAQQEALAEAVSAMREPQIVPKMLDGSGQGKSFRLMGQRFTLDAQIMQQLVEPIKRPLPSALDVLSAFGHDHAEAVLRQYNDPAAEWEGYDRKLLEMKAMAAGLDEAIWKKDLYHGWLGAIDLAAASWEEVDGAPPFMATQAWTRKSLATALGSYAELKHDNVLYSKQVMAERGGPDEIERFAYVEPQVALYEHLAWLTAYTKENLAAKMGQDDVAMEPLVFMGQMLDLLIGCSVKELEGRDLTADERRQMLMLGGLVDSINYMYLGAFARYVEEYTDEDTSALVSDVATALGVGYLEQGVGLPHEIYAIVMVNGRKLLAKGSVYSYYEFVSKERLTDEAWLDILETGSIDHLETMPWMASFLSPEPNKVVYVQPEVQW